MILQAKWNIAPHTHFFHLPETPKGELSGKGQLAPHPSPRLLVDSAKNVYVQAQLPAVLWVVVRHVMHAQLGLLGETLKAQQANV